MAANSRQWRLNGQNSERGIETLLARYWVLAEFIAPRLGLDQKFDIILPESNEQFEELTETKIPRGTQAMATALRDEDLYFSPGHQLMVALMQGPVTADNRSEIAALKLMAHEMAHLLKEEPGWDNEEEQKPGEAVTEAVALRFMAHVPFEGQPLAYLVSLLRTTAYPEWVGDLVGRMRALGLAPSVVEELVRLDGEDLVARLKYEESYRPGRVVWLLSDIIGIGGNHG